MQLESAERKCTSETPIIFQFLKEASASYESHFRSNSPTQQHQQQATTESSLQQSQQVRIRKTITTGLKLGSIA